MVYFKVVTSICVEGLRKTMRNLSEVDWSPGQDSNQGSPKYEQKY
jgi:hypothetical protein